MLSLPRRPKHPLSRRDVVSAVTTTVVIFLLAKHDHVPVTNRSRGPTNVLGEKQLQQHLLLVAESLDCANGKKGRPKNAIHCCLVKRVWLSELFGNAIRVPVGILAVVPDALLAEAWTTHSGGGDCLGGLTNATKERFSFCRQKKQYIWLTHHKRTIQNDVFANTRCLLRKRFLPLWACQLRRRSAIRAASWVLHTSYGATKLVISGFSVDRWFHDFSQEIANMQEESNMSESTQFVLLVGSFGTNIVIDRQAVSEVVTRPSHCNHIDKVLFRCTDVQVEESGVFTNDIVEIYIIYHSAPFDDIWQKTSTTLNPASPLMPSSI